MMRPKSSARDLPPRMLRRVRTLASGKRWEGYYYDGRDESGNRKEIPLGTDISEAKRKWAELECQPAPVETGIMRIVFDRYAREIIPSKAIKTQAGNFLELARLRSVFDTAPIDAITPQHIAQYRDARMTKARTLKAGTVIPARRATVAANRELALFSTIFNKAREWGYTAKTNPCAGVAKNKETPRSYYADDSVWQAVRNCAAIELQDAMDLAYLSGQRPGDVLRFTQRDIVDDALTVQQGKTSKRLAIMLTDPDSGARSELGRLLDRISARTVRSLWLLATPDGKRLTTGMLRLRFTAAREAASCLAEKAGDARLALRIRQFQFRDARPKAASEITLDHASDLLGHTGKQITKVVYQRVGKRVKPTK